MKIYGSKMKKIALHKMISNCEITVYFLKKQLIVDHRHIKYSMTIKAKSLLNEHWHMIYRVIQLIV